VWGDLRNKAECNRYTGPFPIPISSNGNECHNKRQNKLYFLLYFFGHSRTAMLCSTAGLKIVLLYVQMLRLQVLWTSLTDLLLVENVLSDIFCCKEIYGYCIFNNTKIVPHF
jgi:hypothetical protein